MTIDIKIITYLMIATRKHGVHIKLFLYMHGFYNNYIDKPFHIIYIYIIQSREISFCPSISLSFKTSLTAGPIKICLTLIIPKGSLMVLSFKKALFECLIKFLVGSN